MTATVGDPLPAYFQTGAEPVIAILDCGGVYKACTASRGVATGDGVFVGKASTRSIAYFDGEA